MTLQTKFRFGYTVAHHLEELSTMENKSINALIQDMIEERYEKLKRHPSLIISNLQVCY